MAKNVLSRRARAHRLITHAKSRAKKKRIKFNLDVNEIEDKLNFGLCEKTGIPFDFSANGKKGTRSIYTPTIDRINPSMGYTSANTQVVIMAYNGLKSTGTDFQAVQVARAIVECYDSNER